MGFTIPDRVDQSMTGSQFVASIYQNMGQVREDAILQQLALGNVPSFMRMPFQVSLTSGSHCVVLDVLPDYFCIGTDDDFIRMPMWPRTAQLIADSFDATLPTRRVVDQIWRLAEIQVTPRPLAPTTQMVSTDAFQRHNVIIEQQRAGRAGMLAGHKKDIVLTPQLVQHPKHVAIYGWHELTGHPIQPLNPVSHSDTYVDYSHGVRLIARDVLLDGQPARFETILQSPDLCDLVSDEGISTFLRYPTA